MIQPPLLRLTVAALITLTTSRGELLVYEPFDYAVINDPTFGALTGRNGGLGFSGPWQAEPGASNAFIYDHRGNPEELFSGYWGDGLPDWDKDVKFWWNRQDLHTNPLIIKGDLTAGFGWHQGWNDNGHPITIDAYEANLVDFINDMRDEFGHPTLPFSIGATGHGGSGAKGVVIPQLAVADPAKHPDLAGTVFTADTRPFWREPDVSPVDDVSHWHANGETLFLIGDAMGQGLVEMLQRQ